MTDVKRERVAKMILATFRDVWCDRETDDEKPFFNCSKCDFAMDDGRCSVKLFLKSTKYEETYPDGMVKGGDDE